jgi:transmembrane protein EpsG
MVDLFTYFLYFFVITLLVTLTSYKQKFTAADIEFEASPKLRLQHFAGLLILSLIIGFRYKVGVDWEGYKDGFNSIKSSPFLLYRDQFWELGYFFINKTIAKLGLSYEWMFFTVALISWYFIFKSFPKLLLPLLIFFLFVDEYFFWSMNGVRQFAAMSIWMLATRYIINKKLVKYLLLIFIASLFHRSVLILVPFYFIPYHILYKKHIWIILFVISLIIGSSNTFVDFMESTIFYLGQKIEIIGLYIHYIELNAFQIDEETQTGLGFLFKILVNLILIIISNRVMKKYPQTRVYFILFFIGAVLFNLTYNIQLLGRINNYFIIIKSMVLAISVFHFWQMPKNRFLVVIFILLYLFLCLTAIYNSSNMCSPFRFTFFNF